MALLDSLSLIERFGLLPPFALACDAHHPSNLLYAVKELTSASASASASRLPSARIALSSKGVKEEPPPLGKSVSSSLRAERKDGAGLGATVGLGLLGPAFAFGDDLVEASNEIRGVLGSLLSRVSRGRLLIGMAIAGCRT